jgi:hypothetical protein
VSIITTNASNIFGVHVNASLALASSKQFDLYALFDHSKFTSICLEELKCAKCSGDGCNNFLSSHTETLKVASFLKTDNVYRFEAEIGHSCGIAQELNTSSGVKSMTSYKCHWNGTWLPDPGFPLPECACKKNYFPAAITHIC